VTPAPIDRERISHRAKLLRSLRIVAALGALGLLGLLIHYIGPGALARELLAAGPGFLWILLLHGLAIAISGLPWHVLLPPAARPTITQSIASRFVAAGANAVTPVIAFAGDLVRLFWLPHKADRPHGVAAIVVDRLTYGAANAVFVVAGVLALVHVGLADHYVHVSLIGAAVLAALVIVGGLLAVRFRLIGRVHHWIARLRRKERDHQFGDDVDASIRRMLRDRPGPLVLALAFNLLYRLLITAEILIAFRLIGVELGFAQTLVFAALPIVIAMAGFFVPSQLGVQEGAQVLIASSFGIDSTVAVAAALLLRIRSLVGGALVAILIATKRSTIDEAKALANSTITPAGASSPPAANA
jgi:uncharacterized protein (TIRG00374 family)